MKRTWLCRLAAGVLLVGLTTTRLEAQQSVRDAARTLLGGNFTEAEIDSVASVLAQQIATFPIGTSSGGFKFDINPKTFVATPRRDDFGPFFAERASTLGGGVTLAVNAQATTFEAFEGRGLRNGDLRSRTVIGGRLVDIDWFTFNVSTQTTTFVATAAVDDHADLSIVVPFVRTSLNGTASALDLAAGTRVERIVDASAAGLGDVVLRGKWNFYPGLAAAAEVFLPTGSTERLSGTGHYRFKPMFVASTRIGTFSPHINLGYTFGGRGTKVTTNGAFLPTIDTPSPATSSTTRLAPRSRRKGRPRCSWTCSAGRCRMSGALPAARRWCKCPGSRRCLSKASSRAAARSTCGSGPSAAGRSCCRRASSRRPCCFRSTTAA